MANQWCPSLEQFTPASLHFGSSGGLKTEIKEGEEEEEEEERSPIYSLSKSSVDIVMATKSPHLRDPAWGKLDLRRSASQNTQSFPNSNTLQLRPLQQYRQQHTPTQPNVAQNIHQNRSPLRNECVERWSVYSGSLCSSGSTPETVIWKGGASRPCSMTEETLRVPYIACCMESQTSVPTPATPSPCPIPLNTPTNSPVIHACHPLYQFRTSPLTPDTHCQTHQSLPMSSYIHVTSPPTLPMTNEGCQLNPYKEKERVPHKNHSFYLDPHAPPCPFPSPTCKAQGVDGMKERRSSEKFPLQPQCTNLRTYYGEKSPMGVCLGSPVQQQEAEMNSPVFLPTPPPAHPAMSWLPRHTCQSGRVQRLKGLVLSFSDSQLDGSTHCCYNSTHSGIMKLMTSLPQGTQFREEGTMTSQRELVDVGVQVGSQLGSLQSTLKDPGSDINLAPPQLCYIYMGSNSYLSSQSILGSPPGSSLNLRSALGSHSNLASSSSTMFPPDSPREELGAVWEETGGMGRRRSCLKLAVPGEDSRSGGHSKRRNSMKQVQWDEDGLTWDVYGASLDPEELSSAIEKHLQLKTRIDNLTTESTAKTKIKSRNKTSKTKTKTPLMQTATPTTTSKHKRTNTGIATLPMATIYTVATFDTENEIDTTEDRQQGDRECEKEGYECRKGKKKKGGRGKVPRKAKGDLKGERNEDRKEEGDGKECKEGGQRCEEEDGTLMLSNKQSSNEGERSWKKTGRVMRSLKRCIHSSNPND